MLKTLLLLQWRIGQPTAFLAAPKMSTKPTQAARRMVYRQQEKAAEKQFWRLISKARIQRQRQVANAIRQATAAKSTKAAAPKNIALYAKNRNIAKAELIAIAKEVEESKRKARDIEIAPPSVTKTMTPVKPQPTQRETRDCDKKKAAREARFLASLQRRVEKRKARINALLAKRTKIEDAKANAQAKAQAKEEAAAELAAKAQQDFEETLRRRQEKQAARVKAIVDSRAKASAEAEAANASAEKRFAEKLQRLEKEREERIEAIIAEHLNAGEAAGIEIPTHNAAAEPATEKSKARKSRKKGNTTSEASLENLDVAPSEATEPTSVAPVKAVSVEVPVKKVTARQPKRRVASSKTELPEEAVNTTPTESIEEVVATPSEAYEMQTASELPPSASESPQVTTDNAEELKKAHEEVVAQLEKATQQSTPLSSRTPPAPRTWSVPENSTGLFRL